jgi:hypothetical protein
LKDKDDKSRDDDGPPSPEAVLGTIIKKEDPIMAEGFIQIYFNYV